MQVHVSMCDADGDSRCCRGEEIAILAYDRARADEIARKEKKWQEIRPEGG